MKKLIITCTFILMALASVCFAGSPPVAFDKVILSGVNLAMTTQLSNGKTYAQPSSIFARLEGGHIYTFVFNAELDTPVACQAFWLGEDATLWEPVTNVTGEGRVTWEPPFGGLYAISCIVPMNKVDLVGIVIEE